MNTPFKLEGSFCFAKVPPGFEIEIQLYDIYSDGSKNMIMRVTPKKEEEENAQSL